MPDFKYNIVTLNEVSIVTFKGRMSKDIKALLVTCRQELVDKKAMMYVLYFKDVPVVEPSIFREMVLLQQELRKQTKDLFVVGLNSELKQYLLEKAILRTGEIKGSLDEVLQSKTKKEI